MKAFNRSSIVVFGCAVLLLTLAASTAAVIKSKPPQNSRTRALAKWDDRSLPPKLDIRRDARTGKVILLWQGRAVLKKADGWSPNFRRVYRGTGSIVIDPTETVALYSLESDAITRFGGPPVVSANVVGYVNVRFPPGISLVASPLRLSTNTLANVLTGALTPPDGCQILKYSPDTSYEVSTFDAVSGTWSNPDMDIGVGTGFYFNNPSSLTVTQTFVGDVLQGWLTNALPAGSSMKGSMLPIAGSINDEHQIPGEPGDEIRTYVNDGLGGYFNISVFDETTLRWEPDLTLRVAEGFWITRKESSDWVRFFIVQ